MSKSSDFQKTVLRETYPSFLPAPIIRFIDRLIAPAGKLWRTFQKVIKCFVLSACVVALSPVVLVMADPWFGGNFFSGKVMTFEQYQRFLQSDTFWFITTMFNLLYVVFYFYFDGLAAYSGERDRRFR